MKAARGKTLQGLHLHFDPVSGIAGDMTVSALVDLGVPPGVVSDAVASMGVKGLKTAFESRKRGAFVGLGFVVTWPGKKTHSTAHEHEHPHAHAHEHEHAHAHEHEGGHAHEHSHDHVPTHEHVPAQAPVRNRKRVRPVAHKRVHDHGAGHAHRDYAEIRSLLRRATLDARVRDLAAAIFDRIARVEAALHGTTVDRVAFHEVGAHDSIADVVGAAAALAWLAPVSVSSGSPVLGSGHVHTAHGVVGVPAPATAALLEGVPVLWQGQGELTTPTGAAILAEVVQRFGLPPPMRLVATGKGAGTRELADRPNVLRVLAGHPVGQPLADSADEVAIVQANIDDMTPQLVAVLCEELLAAGALDAWSTAIAMKKGRPAVQVSALASDHDLASVRETFFRHSTTLGLRLLRAHRETLSRSAAQVATPFGKVSVKLAALDGEIIGAAPEFEDCRRLALKAGVTTRSVHAAAAAAAQGLLPGKPSRTRGPR
jgi:hypothetical protein